MFGADGNLYVTGGRPPSHIGVLRYEGTTGDFIDLFASTIGLAPIDLAFGPNGNLYVVAGDGVLRFNGATGAFIDNFVSPGSGGLASPFGLTFFAADVP